MSIPTPEPTPQGTPRAPTSIQDIQSLAGAVGSGGTSFDSTVYGLPTQLQNVQLNASGLIPAPGPTTALQLLQMFMNMGQTDPGTAAEIQLQLAQAGYYPSGYTPQQGVLGLKDFQAFGKFLSISANQTIAAQQNNSPLPVLGDVLTTQSQAGSVMFGEQQAAKMAEAAAKAAMAPVMIKTPDPNSLAQIARDAWQHVLGRAPSDSEISAFVHSTTQAMIGAQDTRGAEKANAKLQADYAMAQYNASQPQTYQPITASNAAQDFSTPFTQGGLGQRVAGDLGENLPSVVNRNNADSPVMVITTVANQLGIDPRLALAIAQHESGLNPNIAVMDHHADGSPAGYSVGLYQLNDNGEGAGMSIAQRKDPWTNAQIALRVVAAVAKAHPDWSPGQIAAAAQRPADPTGYAKSVNTLYAANNFQPTVAGSQSGLAQAAFGASAPDLSNLGSPQEFFYPQVDPTADALAQARKAHPQEAGAHDVANTFSMFLDLIGGHMGGSGPGGTETQNQYSGFGTGG